MVLLWTIKSETIISSSTKHYILFRRQIEQTDNDWKRSSSITFKAHLLIINKKINMKCSVIFYSSLAQINAINLLIKESLHVYLFHCLYSEFKLHYVFYWHLLSFIYCRNKNFAFIKMFQLAAHWYISICIVKIFCYLMTLYEASLVR